MVGDQNRPAGTQATQHENIITYAQIADQDGQNNRAAVGRGAENGTGTASGTGIGAGVGTGTGAGHQSGYNRNRAGSKRGRSKTRTRSRSRSWERPSRRNRL